MGSLALPYPAQLVEFGASTRARVPYRSCRYLGCVVVSRVVVVPPSRSVLAPGTGAGGGAGIITVPGGGGGAGA
jgi:hypothetical protein